LRFADSGVIKTLCVIDQDAAEAARAAGRNDPEPVYRLAPCPSLAGKWEMDLRDTAVTWLAQCDADRIDHWPFAGVDPHRAEALPRAAPGDGGRRDRLLLVIA
jgi:hypothetical protein